MTEAEVKAIECICDEMYARRHMHHDECWQRARSRLLTVEAELGRVKAERDGILEHADDAVFSWGRRATEAVSDDTARAYQDCVARLEAALRSYNRAAPPSPPVAPEPAQEDQDDDEERDPVNGQLVSATVGKTNSGEAAGDGVTLEAVSELVHDNWVSAKRLAGVTSRTLDSTGEELMVPYAELSEEAKELDRGTVRVVLKACREQSERGAAGLRATAKQEAEIAEGLRCHVDELVADRDAERTQKEAALALAAEWEKLRNLCYRELRACQDKRDALRAENEELKAKLAWARGGGGCNCAPNHMHDCPAYQQPAEAAPVAKKRPRRFSCSSPGCSCHEEEEATVAKAEAPSEPAGWVPKVGQPVRITGGDLSGSLGEIIDHDPGRTWPYGVMLTNGYTRRFTLDRLEPAPQPPATTGGDRLAGSIVIEYSDGSSEAYALSRRKT